MIGIAGYTREVGYPCCVNIRICVKAYIDFNILLCLKKITNYYTRQRPHINAITVGLQDFRSVKRFLLCLIELLRLCASKLYQYIFLCDIAIGKLRTAEGRH